jgi:membrane-bound lytic murein transglycosylase B
MRSRVHSRGYSFASLIVVTLIAFGFALTPSDAFANKKFEKWIGGFYKVAKSRGISKSTYRAAFRGITSPDPEILPLTRYQPEFTQEMWMYFDPRVNEKSEAKGREMRKKWGAWLSRIEKRLGVDRHILLAIWSMETSYGKALEKPKSLRNVFRSLATLAYADKRRRKYARTQLIHALKIVQSGKMPAHKLTGSWAGAMGHTQFIPSSYNAWAVDMDGDGRKDIWRSIPDALATAANLLRKNGWRKGKTWGYEVKLPKKLARSRIGKTMTLAQWDRLGVRRANGKKFPRGKDKAVLKRFAGARGPSFLVLKNFYVLKRYNNADKYALAVGHLADRIAGYGKFKRDWPRKYPRMSEPERMEIQRYLARKGLYDGEIDGTIGSGSRKAIRKLQEKFGMKPDGYASKPLLAKMRKH